MNLFSPEQTLRRINELLDCLINRLSDAEDPALVPCRNRTGPSKSIDNISQCRGYTSAILVLSFVQKLLLSNRTATNREVYYVFVTHFRSQRECDASIMDVCNLLGVERIALGLSASPRGWYCGRIEISRPSNDKFTNLNGSTQSVQGLPITKEWIYKASQILNYKKDHPGEKLPTENSHSVFPYDFEIKSDACCIMVVEKEGIYLRLSEDRFFDRVPCIIVTGKGFPDVATRAMVYVLHHTLSIPVFGVCDCNPFGVAVLQTYQQGGSNGRKEATDREIYDIPIYWLGLRPSHVEQVKGELPPEVYQELTDLDKRKIEKLCCQGSSFRNVKDGEKRVEELIAMRANGYKVELESLHWLGWQYMCDWLEAVITEYSEANKEDR